MKKPSILTIILILLLGAIILIFTPSRWKSNLISPMGQKPQVMTVSPTPMPTPNQPKTFKFDRSTDLKAELDKINPQVLDSDFN